MFLPLLPPSMVSHTPLPHPFEIMTPADVNVAFQQAMVRVGMDSEGMTKQFQLMVPFTKTRGGHGEAGRTSKGRTSEGSSPSGSGWDQLTLSHTVKWPLPILFTPIVLSK